MAVLIEVVVDRGLGGFGDVLDDDEIRDVLAYIRSRWPEEIRRRQAGITERAGKAD